MSSRLRVQALWNLPRMMPTWEDVWCVAYVSVLSMFNEELVGKISVPIAKGNYEEVKLEVVELMVIECWVYHVQWEVLFPLKYVEHNQPC